MKYYWENETQEVISEAKVKAEFSMFGHDYESYSDYLSACMYWNNGSLTPLAEKISSVKKEILRKESLNDEFYSEDVAELKLLLDYLTSFEGK